MKKAIYLIIALIGLSAPSCSDSMLDFSPTDSGSGKELLKSASTAIRNLARLSSHFILLSWNVPDSVAAFPHRDMTDEDIIPHFENEGYTVEKYMTARLHVVLKRKDCSVLTRRNLPLINY